jgi:outer membrane protein assembly factor BamE
MKSKPVGPHRARLVAAAIALAIVATAAGCTRPKLYRIDIQQGNVVTQDMVARLKPDMTRSQVRYVLGTPTLVDAFHPDRWDYFYSFSRAGGTPEQRVLTLVFADDRLKRIVGDVTPAGVAVPVEAPPAAAADASKADKP